MDRMDQDVYRRLCRARELMDDCYADILDLKQISQEACISLFHFIRLFKQAFRVTPHQYLVRRRLYKAQELLAHSSLSVTDVCLEVGFQSLGSFSSLFHKTIGHSPLSYRTRVFGPARVYDGSFYIPACFAIIFGFQSVEQKQF
ncbi:MAG TPA: AraC family transcriptional regulator [Acidobacteriota bacterium]|nr:AraC family transcriptional regulator [Acidobacteriota bacterium]